MVLPMAFCFWKFAVERRRSLLFSLVVIFLATCQGQNLSSTSTSLMSTESTVTLEWAVNSSARTYQLTWHRSLGIFIMDEFFVGPFNDSRLNYTAIGLVPGAIYIFSIFQNGNTSTHLIYQKEVATVPLPPGNLTITNRTSNSVLLTWERGYNTSLLLFYEVQYTESGLPAQRVVSNSSVPEFNLTGLLPGHLYTVALYAVILDKRSNVSQLITAITLPAAPVNLSAKALSTSALQVMWEAAPSSLQSSFSVSYRIDGRATISTVNCTTSPCDVPVTGEPGQLYIVAVYAVQQTFRSSPALVQRNTAPTPPSKLNGVGAVRSLQLTWEMPAGSLYRGFRIRLRYVAENSETSVNVTRINDTTAYSYNVSGLVGGVGYLVQVHSVSATEESIDSASQLLYTLPEPVTGLFGEAANTTALRLSWQTPANSVYTGLQLNLTSSASDQSSFALPPNQSSLTVDSLIPGVEYTVKVVVRAVGAQSMSTIGTFRTRPDAPKIVSIETKEDLVTVAMNVSGKGVYDSIQAGLLETREVRTVNAKGEVAFTGLAPGTKYTLVAFTKSGSENSTSLQQIVFTKPRPPRSVSVLVLSSRALSISWQAPDRGGVDTYTVILSPAHGTETPVMYEVTELALTFDKALPGETYNVSVRANKGSETSVTVVEQNTTIPFPLTHIRVSLRGTGFVTVTWDTPSGSVFDGFAYDFPRFNESLVRLPPVPLSKKFESLAAESNYTVIFYVISRSAAGIILYSLPTVFNFTTYPESVAALQKVDATVSSITVNWTAPTSGNFSSYQLGIDPPDSLQSIIQVLPQRMQHTFEQLKSGKNYMVAIRTVIGQNNFGQAVRLQALTKPLAVMGLNVMTLDSQSLRVKWSVNGSSEQNSFTVLQENNGVRRMTEVNSTSGQVAYEVTLTKLLPGYTYIVTVSASRTIDTDQEYSQAMTMDGTTNPLPVQNLLVTASDRIITVTWSPGVNSRQDIYVIRYRHILANPDERWLEATAITNATQVPIAHPGEEYQLSVVAKSNVYSSDPTNASVVVAPVPPVIVVDKESTTTSNVTVRWSYNPSVSFTEMWSVWYYNASGGWSSKLVNITRTSDINYSYDLSGLRAGVTYTVEVVAVVKGVKSSPVKLNATAKPVINTVLSEIKESTSQSQIAVKYSITNTDVFDSFVFTLQNDPNSVHKLKEDSNQTVVFSGLQSGKLYIVGALTVSRDVSSDPVTVQVITVPVQVEVTFESKADVITVQLGKQRGSATGYRIICTTSTSMSCGDILVEGAERSIAMRNLLSYTNYSIKVVTEARYGGDVKDVEATYFVQTQEAAPSSVNMFKAVENGFRSVLLSWIPPSYLNGQLRHYILAYSGSHPSGGQDPGSNLALPDTSTSVKLDNLKAGYTYVFKIQAVTVTASLPSEVTLPLSTVEPSFKAGMTKENSKPFLPAEGAAATENSVSVQLKNVFSDDGGPVLAYTVVVSRDSSHQDSRAVLPSWKDAHDDPSLVVYQATSNCSDLFHMHSTCGKPSLLAARAAGELDSVVFTLGVQLEEDCKSLTFCNGPLNPGTDYYIKLRAFTASGFTDTGYSAKVRTADSVKSSAVKIAVPVVVVTVVVVSVVVVAFFIVRRKQRPKRATKYRPAYSSRALSDGAHLKHFSRPVKVIEFPEHVQRMGADSDFKYAEEYEDLKEVGRDQTCYAAELPVNRPKNRFTNILPYDHSRVKLLPTDDEEGSDYINANYMPGYNSKREYIATQGPLPATRDDFWRMVWEQNSCNIVMLTRCMEKGREKSDHYWPSDSEPKFYGDLQVVVLHETHLPDWTITEFRVSLGDNCRQVRHFHYKAWPDFGVPKHHTSLIRFVRTVRDKLIKDGGPIVTHCSAGVGRSGTFIVLDHVLQLIKEKDEVDIFNIVYSLRRERVLMVQTEQQYKFIHECLACILEGREDETTYANIGRVNVGFEDDEGINVEVPT